MSNQYPFKRWHWHDAFGRLDGKGEPKCGRNILNEEPPLGQCSHFSFVVSDEQGFVIARCSNALVTMSSERSEANARLISMSPELLWACKIALDQLQGAKPLGGVHASSLNADIAIIRSILNEIKGNI